VLASANRALVAEQLSILRRLDDEPATALLTADGALRDLDAAEPQRRWDADVIAHEVTARRAPTVAVVLASLASCHLADDHQRGIDDWHTRFAFVQGTTPATLAHLRDATRQAYGLAGQWWRARPAVVGSRYCDRRVGPSTAPASVAEHARQAALALAAAVPRLAPTVHEAASRITPGADNQVVIEADGRISATVVHRPTPRGSMMVAHEIGHAVHALASLSTEPPGALVGETVACWASLVTGRAATAHDASAPAFALALGDTLVEELFVSAAVSEFEDSVYALAARGAQVPAAALDAAWLGAQRDLFGDAVEVPEHVASGWARLPSLATDPGHAVSYVWATLLALAIGGRHGEEAGDVLVDAFRAGGVDADEFTAMLGFVGDGWIDEGLTALAVELERLAQLIAG
jgi:hypothetical protein